MAFRYGRLEDTIVDVIRESVEGKDVGIAFSGGLDSGLVAAISKRYADSVNLYTCGTNNAFDVCMAKDLSEKLELPWTHVQISKGNIEGFLREMIAATDESDPFTLSYELQLFCVCRASGEDYILTGQGADEYFMGCAKFVDQSDEDYDVLNKAAVERLINVSVPCEKKIAAHFGKGISYPYMHPSVTAEVAKLDPEDLRPKDMDSRKAVLKAIATDLGYPFIAGRKKKSSQYGSGTTDLVRALAREKDMMYNEYMAYLYDEVSGRMPSKNKDAVYARIDPILKASAETILYRQGLSPSKAVEMFYRRIVEDEGLQSVQKR